MLVLASHHVGAACALFGGLSAGAGLRGLRGLELGLGLGLGLEFRVQGLGLEFRVQGYS